MSSHDPIAYTYDADTHCPPCAELRFGRTPDGFIAGEDADGRPQYDAWDSPVGAIAPWEEWCEPSEVGVVTLSCGTCGGIIEQHRHDEAAPPCGHFRHWGDGVIDDGTGDWETCDECGRLVCFDTDCPNGWRWDGTDVLCYTHDGARARDESIYGPPVDAASPAYPLNGCDA